MSDISHENDYHKSDKGYQISTETIAGGKLRIKTKIWYNDLDIEKGIQQSIKLQDQLLKDFRKKGYKIEGDPENK